MSNVVKQDTCHASSSEKTEQQPEKTEQQPPSVSPIEISSSDEEDNGSGGGSRTYWNSSHPRGHGFEDSPTSPGGDEGSSKRKKTRSLKEIDTLFLAKRLRMVKPLATIPPGFLAPLHVDEVDVLHDEDALPVSRSPPAAVVNDNRLALASSVSRKFWKAGEFGNDVCADSSQSSVGMDRVRVHPRFLHSNATSHKWALGAFAELLDNALDEVCNGATYVQVDVLTSRRDNSKMLLVEDNGGGMTPDKLRHCMSLGYSAKSKIADTIGQYGNGFKTSTMRLGSDVIVFSRCRASSGKSASQSIGMLSYTFLRSTQKEDIVVPMIDYEKRGQVWEKLIRSSSDDWSKNVETILQWSPFPNESDLLKQFDFIKNQGTRIIIYNLWEDDEGKLELDFETDPTDIQIRGVNRDERSLKMAKLYPNSRHFLTYKHSLRSYASILYLRLPPGFSIYLRGQGVQHHNIVNDMMLSQEVTYRPKPTDEMGPNNSGMVATVTIGFVKDAHFHVDIQGFNVYHKNRLIKPFWRVWNAAGSSGRGVIAVLEANFIEPAHDKQGFERTIALSRLEARLVVIQKAYWNKNCHHVGYSEKRQKNKTAAPSKKEDAPLPCDKSKASPHSTPNGSGCATRVESPTELDMRSTPIANIAEDRGSSEGSPPCRVSQQQAADNRETNNMSSSSHKKDDFINGDGPNSARASEGFAKLKEVNLDMTRRVDEIGSQAAALQNDLTLEKERRKTLEKQLTEAENKIGKLLKENMSLRNSLDEDRRRGKEEEEKLRKKLLDASNTIDDLLEKVRLLQKRQV